jgi:hypothetical protein
MNRAEAMKMAVEIIDKWSTQPSTTGTNAYNKTEVTRTPTLGEKVAAAEQLASFLWDAEDVKVDDASRD